jgi:hypothetical protein
MVIQNIPDRNYLVRRKEKRYDDKDDLPTLAE